MTIIDADKFLAYLIYSKHIDGLTCGEVKEAVEMCKVDVLDKIRTEINQYGSIWVQYTIKGHTDKDIEDIVEDVIKQAKQQMLDLIDKYRNEVSE